MQAFIQEYPEGGTPEGERTRYRAWGWRSLHDWGLVCPGGESDHRGKLHRHERRERRPLTHTGNEDPGPGVSTRTRAGCSKNLRTIEGTNPASGCARNTG